MVMMPPQGSFGDVLAAILAFLGALKTVNAKEFARLFKFTETLTIAFGQLPHNRTQFRQYRQGRMAARATRKFQLLEQQFNFMSAVGIDGSLAAAKRAEVTEEGINSIADQLAFVPHAGKQRR